MKILLISLFLSRVSAEMQTVHHSMYVSRKSRSNSPPVETSYVFSQYNNDPGIMYGRNNYKYASSGGDMMDKHRKPSNEYSSYHNSAPLKYSELSVPISDSNDILSGPLVIEPYIRPATKHDIDYERSKLEAEMKKHAMEPYIKSGNHDIDYERSKLEAEIKKHEPYIKSGNHDIDYERSKLEAEIKKHEPYIKAGNHDIDYERSKLEADMKKHSIVPYINAGTKHDIDYERSKLEADMRKHIMEPYIKTGSKHNIDYEISKSEAEIRKPVMEPYIRPRTKHDIDYEISKSEAEMNKPVMQSYIKPTTKHDIDYEISKSEAEIRKTPMTEPYNYPVTKHDIDYEISKSKAELRTSPVTEVFIKPVTKLDFDYESSKSKAQMTGHPVADPYIEPVSKLDIDYERSKSEAKMNAPPVTEPYIETVTKFDSDYERSKSEVEFDRKYIPLKLKSDLMYEKLKSYMHYSPPDGHDFNEIGYDMDSDYHIDDDDIRTSSRINYAGWPYFFHSPYEYEIHKVDSDIEKAKDKRYASDNSKLVIPVHETIENDIPNYKSQFLPPTYHHEVTTDNPVHGDKPFISFVLNDYIDKSYDEDPVVFKGFDYGKDFDFQGDGASNGDEYNKIKRRVQYSDSPKHDVNHIQNNHLITDTKQNEGDSVTEKGHSKKHEFNKKEKKKEEKEAYKKGFEKSQNGYKGFKDFADAYANKFGAEGHEKESKYEFKNNADNGERKKGFRRVYHKDEYQEDNEFYENKNNSARGTEKGTAFNHGNGSEGLIKSHSTAAIGNESNALSEAGGKEGNKFENSHQGHDYSHGYDNDFNRYRDVAKKAAQSNSADYGDHFTV